MNRKKIKIGNKARKGILWVAKKGIDSTLGHVENYITAKQDQPEYPPIFIVGPARSGTTLIYQSIIYYFNVSYFSNSMTFFPSVPAITAKILSYVNGCSSPKNFSSNYGKVKGWNAPSQGHQIWIRWFPKNQSANRLEFSQANKRKLTGTLSYIEKCYQAPFVNKWPGFSVYLLQLASAFPNALFIRVQRDYLQNAQSILKGRYDLTGDPGKSISRVPVSYKQYEGRDYIEQVCAYLYGIEEQLKFDIQKIGSDKVFNVRYEDFCTQPLNIMRQLKDWYDSMSGRSISIRNNDFPDKFHISKTQKIDDSELEVLNRKLKELYFKFKLDNNFV